MCGGVLAVFAHPDDESLLTQLRSIVAQPWDWRQGQDEARSIVLPEDLRLLLAQGRASKRNGTMGAAPRAVWSRLPEPVQRAALRLFRR